MQIKTLSKWIAPAIKVISTIVVVIILAAAIKETSPYPYIIVLVCTVIPFALVLIKRLMRLEMPIAVDFIVLIFVIMAADLGSSIGLYDTIDCFDLIVHGFFGFLSCVIMLYVWQRFVGEKPRAFGLICIFLITMGFAALWECWEFISDLIFHQGAQPGLSDTMTDILIAAVGAIIFLVTYLIDFKLGGKIYRLDTYMEK